jgi:hypothetical protein
MLYQYINASGARNAVLDDFETSYVNAQFNNTSTNKKVPPGKAAYVAFTPNMTCYAGVVSTSNTCDTSDQGVKNVKERFEGRSLRICVPTKYTSGPAKRRRNKVQGRTALVEISEEEANKEDMKTNPALQSSSDDDEDDEKEGSATPLPSGSVVLPGGSGRVEVRWTSGTVGAIVAVWMVGFM